MLVCFVFWACFVCVPIAIVNISYCGSECVRFTNVRRCVNVLLVLFSKLVWCDAGKTNPKLFSYCGFKCASFICVHRCVYKCLDYVVFWNCFCVLVAMAIEHVFLTDVQTVCR